jgi:hypothetical protein
MTVIVTAHRRVSPHAFRTPVVRELPIPRPAAGVSAW